jgi:hypothetical protein
LDFSKKRPKITKIPYTEIVSKKLDASIPIPVCKFCFKLLLFIQKCQGNMATKEQSKYKTLLTMQTNANVNLCPPGSVVGPPSPELQLGLEFLLDPLLEPEAHLDTVVDGVPHLRL